MSGFKPTKRYKPPRDNKLFAKFMETERLKRCPNCGGYLIDHFEDDRLKKLPCHKWTCPYCGELKRKQLLDVIGFGGQVIQSKGRRWRFMTLTLSTKVDGRRIDLFWQRFRSLLHKHGYRPEYFKVKEFTKNGQRHLHVLIDVFVPFNFIQYAWRMATEGTSFWVHIKKAQIKSAAGYMAKYLTKQTVLSHQFEKGEHRYSFSRKFPRPAKEQKNKEPGRYEYLSAVEYMYRMLDSGGWYEKPPKRPDKTRKIGRHAYPDEFIEVLPPRISAHTVGSL